MKFPFPLLALFAAATLISGCNTLANRRSLYSPKKGEGYWTRTLQDGSWHQRGSGSANDPLAPKTTTTTTTTSTTPIPPPPAPATGTTAPEL